MMDVVDAKVLVWWFLDGVLYVNAVGDLDCPIERLNVVALF